MHDHELDEVMTEEVAGEVGYTECDWDTLDAKEVAAHDDIMEGRCNIDTVDPSSLSDLAKWALAQAYADADDTEGFVMVAAMLVDGKAEHPALDYGEIALEVADEMAIEGRLEEVERWCDRADKLGADASLVELARAASDLWNERRERGLKRVQRVVDDAEWDPNVLLRVVDVLFFADEADGAVSVLERLTFLAAEENDRDLAAIVADLYAAIGEG